MQRQGGEDWLPAFDRGHGPVYAAIVDALRRDVASGRLRRGTRLLPQRQMAKRLQLSIGTISKAYAEAERLGIVAGEVGRGTYVLPGGAADAVGDPVQDREINLGFNIPARTGGKELIADTIAEIAAQVAIDPLLSYQAHQGMTEHVAAISDWLNAQGAPGSPDTLFVTSGAQHALSISLDILTHPGGTVLVEALSYSGIQSIAQLRRYAMQGVDMDEDGLIPERVDEAFSATGARVLFCTPTLQTPTGAVMPLERRERIAEIVRRHDAYVIEDDVFACYLDRTIVPLSSLVPERSFYVTSFAKYLAPGLRIGTLTVPERFGRDAIGAMRASGWSASPIMAEVVCRLAGGGELDRQIVLKKAKARARHAQARAALSEWLAPPRAEVAFHLWLPLPQPWNVSGLIASAARHGVRLAEPISWSGGRGLTPGVRLCLGAAATDDDLDEALRRLAAILRTPVSMAVV